MNSSDDTAANGKSDSAKELNPADEAIRNAYKKSQAATTADAFAEVIALCDEGLQKGAQGESAAYAKKLSGWAHYKRGLKSSEAGNEREAIQDFDVAINLDPGLWRAMHNRAISKANLGDKKGAMTDFDRTVRINPNYANAWFNRAMLKYDLDDFMGAVQDYSQAINLQPRDAEFYNNRGHALYRMGQLRDALRDYDRAVQMDPENTEALLNRGDAYREQGMFGPAASDYRDAVRLNPKFGRAYQCTAWLMATCPDQRFRDADRGVAAAQKAIELDGDKDYRYLDTLAAAQANAGQFDDAKATIERAIKKAPPKVASQLTQRQSLYGNGQAYREGGPPEAVRSANRTP
jgi:tetratricopeptide (TPR) repeat protein